MNHRPAANPPPDNRPATSSPSPAPGLWRPAFAYLVLAPLLLAAGTLLWFFSPGTSQPEPPAEPIAPIAPTAGTLAAASAASPPAHSASQAASSRAPSAPVRPDAPVVDGQDPTRDLSSYVVRGQNPSAAQVIERLHQAGIRSGLGAFSPPGTRPPLIGLAVPDDFVLPDGYVRHHQATDDGQRIEAILMFAPDRQLLDAQGRPIPIPANRVVPPELAPPGLPIRRIVLPKPIDPGRP